MTSQQNFSASSKSSESSENNAAFANVGRNEPCPCGNGKKYKRCHGVDAPGKMAASPAGEIGGQTRAGDESGAGMSMPGGFDPSQFDPAMMQQMAMMMQRLPKGQLQKLQGLIRKAMAGKDVTSDAVALEGQLPVEFQQLMRQFSNQAEEQDKANPEKAAARIEAETKAQEPSKFSKMFGGLFKKKAE